MKQCSHCGAHLLLEDIEAAKCSRCGTFLPFDTDRPSSAGERAMVDVLDHLPASVRHMLRDLGSNPPGATSSSSPPRGSGPSGSGYPGVVIRTVDPAPAPGAKLPSSTPPRRISSRPTPRPEGATSVELLLAMPPPGFDGPAEDPHLALELPAGFSPEQLGIKGSQSDAATAQAEALRRSLQAPPLAPRRRRLNVGQLIIGVLVVVLLATLFALARLYLNGDLG